MKLLKKYYKTIKEIYDYFDYASNGSTLRIEDFTEFYWQYSQNESKSGTKLYYSSKKEDVKEFSDFFVSMHKGEEYTMFHMINKQDEYEYCEEWLVVFDNELLRH